MKALSALARLFRVLATPSTCSCCRECDLGYDCYCGDCAAQLMD